MVIVYVFMFLFGLIIGSFLNCLIWRLHKQESLLNRSYCPKCRRQIAWYDNIPLLSFVILGGRCRYCHQAISWQYPAVELVTAILFLIAFIINTKYPITNFEFPNNIQYPISNIQTSSNFKFQISNFILLFRYWFIISVMIVIFIYDLRWYLILDVVTLPACLAVFILNLLLGVNLWNLLISGIIGSSFFLIQYLISRGKWIGGGDIRLGLLMGLALGWPRVLVAIFMAYLLGSIVGLGLILSDKKSWGSPVPLGIFLSVATVITLFWGEQILQWYLGIL